VVLGYVPHRFRLACGLVFCVACGVLATYASGELGLSPSFILLDIAETAAPAVITLALVHRLRAARGDWARPD
jgi:hypothetical protein